MAVRSMTQEERLHWERALAETTGERDQIEADFVAFEIAAAEDTFSGKLRRAIHCGPLPLSVLAARSDVSWVALRAFLAGEAPLPSDAIDRLMNVLQLELQPVLSHDAGSTEA